MNLSKRLIEDKENKIRLAQAKTYIDINELSLISGYSLSSLRRYLQDGSLKSTTRGTRCKKLFSHSQVDKFLNGLDGEGK